MLELIDLTKRYKKQTVFAGVNSRFEYGVTVISGPSGVGKSTLIRICASAEKQNSGQVNWRGSDITRKPKLFRQVLGYAPQIIEFPEDISAKDFMLHIGALKSISLKESISQTQTILSRLNLLPDIDKPIRSFSGGMRRRLGLAQAFLGNPECLILDEPTAELDPLTAGIIHDLIFEKAQNAVVLMTTHLEASLTDYKFDRFVMQPYSAET